MKSARDMHSQNSSPGPSGNGHVSSGLDPTPTFITVKYADNQKSLFTTWVPVNTLIEWMRKKCKCDRGITLDLVDLEGNMCNLPNHPYEYAQNVLDGRKTYVLIKREKQADGPVKYVSLLEDSYLEEDHPELKNKLHILSSPTEPLPTMGGKKGSSKWGALRGVTRMTSRTNMKKSAKSNNR